ncbi:MAG TPA: universal stress protein [Methylomirabilota bacterium]|jgi:nucleotide-binding universal stress UspA family protein
MPRFRAWNATCFVSPSMRVVIALEPDADSRWAADGIHIFPLSDPLEVVLVSALDVPRPPLTSPGPAARRLYGAAITGLRARARHGAEAAIDGLRAALRPRTASVAVRIVDDQPAPAIVHAAASWDADLILMGASARGAIGRALLGSVADQVVRTAPCPVLLAKRRVARFERMLVATDGSLHAEAALRFVAALPVPPSTELRVCAVSEAMDGGAAMLLLLTDTEKRMALRSVTKALDILATLSCPLQSSVRHGDAGRELVDEVRRWVPDLLVMGARGRTAGSEVALGRVSASLLRHATCPTLVYRG